MNSSKKRSKQTVRVIQVSDPHLGPTAGYQVAGVNTCNSLAAVLTRIASTRGAVDAVVATGDIAGHGEAGAYRLFDRQMAGLGAPYYWLPGNHDDLEVMAANLPVPFRFEIKLGNWLLLMLDSRQPGKVGGVIGAQQLTAACAAADKHRGPVAVFMHHPPVAVGCAWLDRQKVASAGRVLRQLANCGNVKAVFSGHVHQPTSTECKGIEVHTAPSTCFQFAADSDEFALGDQGPGFRWLDFRADGSIDTGVVQLAARGELDKHCVGY